MTEPVRDPFAGLNATGEAIDARRRVVDAAIAEIGFREPSKYWRTVCPDFLGQKPNAKAWCGIFALWCIRQALPEVDWLWSTRASEPGFVWRLSHTALPEPGDVAVFGPTLWHHAIVEDCYGGNVYTIDGNVLPAPLEGVARRKRPILPATSFHSIAKLIGG